MAWVALVVCGLVVWASCAGVYAMGRDIWPGDMPDIVRLAAAPAVASAATVAHKLMTAGFNSVLRAAAFALIVAALDAVILGPLVDGGRAMFRRALGSWLPLMAIFLASWLTGEFAPM